MRLPLLGIVAAALCGGLLTSAHAIDYGDVPTDRMPPERWRMISWENPGNWQTIDVTQHGLSANDPAVDAAAKLVEILGKTTGNRVLYFPEGTYTFKTHCVVTTGNLWLRGAGKDKTVFVFDAPAETEIGLYFTGKERAAAKILGSPAQGDQTVTLSSTEGFTPGSLIELIVTDYQIEGGNRRGTISKVVAVAGNTVSLDMKLGDAIPAEYNPTAYAVAQVDTIRISDLKLSRVRGNKGSSNIKMYYVNNVHIHDIESEWAMRFHLNFDRCKDVIVERNLIHHAYDYGHGGHGYGIAAQDRTTRLIAINNTLHHLRHHVIMWESVNHSIFAYNDCTESAATGNSVCLHGWYEHNNLIEGNSAYLDDIVSDNVHKWHGPNNYYFRNSGRDVGNEIAQSISYSIVGNDISGRIKDDGKKGYIAANKVKGRWEWGSLSESAKIPPSLFLESKPNWLTAWPLYGP